MSEAENWSEIPTIDREILEPLCEVLEESANDVFDEFQLDTPRIAAEIRTALGNDEFSLIAGLTHQLKSSSGSLGGLRVQRLCSWVEKLAQQEDKTALKENCQLLFSAIDDLLLELRRFQSEHNA